MVNLPQIVAMRYAFLIFFLCTIHMVKAQLKQRGNNIVLVVHGGAGTILKSQMDAGGRNRLIKPQYLKPLKKVMKFFITVAPR